VTPQQFVGVAVRLLAIWLGITAFQSFAIGKALADGRSGASWLPYVFTALYFGAAVFLWVFPMAIAHRLVPRTRYADRLTMPAREALVVACVVIGLLSIVFRALPLLSGYLSLAFYWIGGGQPISTLPFERQIDVFVGMTQLVAGLLLVAKADALADRLVPAQAPVSREA